MATTVEHPAAQPRVAERTPEFDEALFRFDQPPKVPTFTVEQLAWFGLAAVAFVMRIWNVGGRAMHHDESMHAFYGFQLFNGGGYAYNPMLHGPFQFHAIALMDFLFGVNETTARLTAVLCGTGIVIATWWLRPYLGKLGAFIAALLFAISPSFLYFSRFTREDIYVTFFTYLMVVGMFGWLKHRRPGYIYLLFSATALAFATKESTFITLFIFGTFLILVVAWENAERVPLLARLRTRAATLAGDGEPSNLDKTAGGFYGVVSDGLLAVGRQTWAIGLICFGAIIILLFTTFLTNRHGLQDAFTASLTYWLGQQGVARGSQPGYYYALLLPAYEQIPVLFGIIGMAWYVFRRWTLAAALVVVVAGQALAVVMGGKGMMPVLALTALALGLSTVVLGLSRGRLWVTFLTYWSIMAFIIYGWAGEKMPWLILQMALPLLLLAATFLGDVLSAARWNEWRWAAGVASAFLVLFALHVDWPLNYIRGDIPKDMLIYTQTSPQVKDAVAQIDQLSNQLTGGKDLKIMYDAASTWPFAWYLRDYKNLAIVPTVSSAPDQPVVITAVENDAQEKQFLTNYVGNRYHLRTWFDESYRELTLDKVVKSVTDPAMRKTLWNWLTLRETPTPLGTYDFNLWIRKDLAASAVSNFDFAPQPQPAAPAILAPDPFTGKETKVASIKQFAQQGTGDGFLTSPRGVAVAADGSVYVADQGDNRIEKFDANGKFLTKWGAKGNGDSQFDTPSGVAVDKTGNVWVTDLWNHRVQEFDANGKFLQKFGSYGTASGNADGGKFFGPRYLTIGADGSVYVSDTGNKRIQKFGPDGKFIMAWGTGGNGPGQFQEPMGLTTDAQGNVYVADTWNRRIQKFGPDGAFQTTISVGSWPTAQMTTGEPNIAVTSGGSVLATDPAHSRVLVFGPDGQLQSAWGGQGADTSSLSAPTGLALAPDGSVVVTDTLNNRIVVFPAVK